MSQGLTRQAQVLPLQMHAGFALNIQMRLAEIQGYMSDELLVLALEFRVRCRTLNASTGRLLLETG